jgi:hypothetical protein
MEHMINRWNENKIRIFHLQGLLNKADRQQLMAVNGTLKHMWEQTVMAYRYHGLSAERLSKTTVV